MMHVNTMRSIIDDLEISGSSPIPAQCTSAFVEGYRRERPIDAEWIDRVGLFVRLEVLLNLARLLQSYEGTDPNADLRWLAAMRARHVDLIDELRERVSA